MSHALGSVLSGTKDNHTPRAETELESHRGNGVLRNIRQQTNKVEDFWGDPQNHSRSWERGQVSEAKHFSVPRFQMPVKMSHEAHGKKATKHLCDSLHLISIINIYWHSGMFRMLGSKTKHPRDTDPAFQRDHILKRKPQNRRILFGSTADVRLMKDAVSISQWQRA